MGAGVTRIKFACRYDPRDTLGVSNGRGRAEWSELSVYTDGRFRGSVYLDPDQLRDLGILLIDRADEIEEEQGNA